MIFTVLTAVLCLALVSAIKLWADKWYISYPVLMTLAGFLSSEMIASQGIDTGLRYYHVDWLAIASQDSEACQRLQVFLQWLQNNHPGRHDFITELGSPVILNNGVEFAVTYFAMLLSLFFTGAGRFLSIDYWVNRRFECQLEKR